MILGKHLKLTNEDYTITSIEITIQKNIKMNEHCFFIFFCIQINKIH